MHRQAKSPGLRASINGYGAVTEGSPTGLHNLNFSDTLRGILEEGKQYHFKRVEL